MLVGGERIGVAACVCAKIGDSECGFEQRRLQFQSAFEVRKRIGVFVCIAHGVVQIAALACIVRRVVHGKCKEARRVFEIRQHRRGDGVLVQTVHMFRREREQGIEVFNCTPDVLSLQTFLSEQ